MKKLLIFPLFLSALLTGCDIDAPINKDQYPQRVYIVGAKDKIIDRDVNIGNSQDTVAVSVAVGGSLPLSQDVTVSLMEDPTAIASYDTKNLSALEVQYRKLNNAIYSYPLEFLTIKAGTVYNTYPIYIKTATLHCDSLYMLALKLKSTSAYQLNQDDTIALVRLNMANKYSGAYNMDAVLKNTTNANDSLVYKMQRNAVATDNGNTIRMYHYVNEWTTGAKTDTRITNALKITVNADNSLTFSTWAQFKIYDGGGTYHPELKLYDFWYTYDNNGTMWKAKGYMYKVTKTDEEQRTIDNWIEAQRSK
ncbi:MAG: DUF4361 domain-containing protein [Bacteroidota bacterium]|nr:DUF4361 domain-containing protein [Bacteroidota bacterium]